MSEASAKETACADCGEMVRINSVRCWNCGAFMNREVEQRFIAMQASPRPIIFSQLPADEMHVVGELDDDDEDDGFQLKTPVLPQIPTSQRSQTSSESQASPPSSSTPASVSVQEIDPADDVSAIDGPPARTASPEKAESDEDVAHSVATGGDVLLDIARQEEREDRKRTRGRRVTGGVRTASGGMLIFCPYGCRVEVRESHRGMTGRCPRCQAPFIVPIDPPIFRAAKPAAGAASKPGGEFEVWLHDLRLHTVDPEKLKLKADSLAKDFTEFDLGFSPSKLLVVSLAKKAAGGGLFAKGSGEKKEAVREQLLSHLGEGKPLSDAPVGDKYVFEKSDLSQLKVVQPAASVANSMFHGIPVFGANRIVVQLPVTEKSPKPLYISMGITEFWKFINAMENTVGINGIDDPELGLPKAPRTHLNKCHFLETPIRSLLDIELFQADPTAHLEIAGYQCGACKATVSEAGRKKENLGGKSPKGIAKAKCPKCGSKMGEHFLYSLSEDVVQPPINSTT